MSDRLHDEIARCAFALFETRGREHGSDWQDWFEAERAVKAGAGDWHVEAPTTSLSADVDSATLALRLGIAVNAIRAAQRFFYFTKDTPGPGGERDRLWAFLLALGFLHEAVQPLLRPNFPKVKTLAQAGRADENLIRAAAALLSANVPEREHGFRWSNGREI